MIAATQYAMRWLIVYPILKINTFEFQFSELNFFLLVLATVFLAAGGYVINDYFDRKTDMVNRPDNVIVGRHINRRLAIILHTVFNIIGVALGFYISIKIGLYQLGFIFLIITGVLWYYSTTYKRQFLIGNLIVSILTAMVPLMVALFEVPQLNKEYGEFMLKQGANFNYIFGWVGAFAFFAFILTLVREIVKDMEDLEGDNAYGRNTLPIFLGIKTSKGITITLIGITIASVVYLYFRYLNDTLSLIYFIVVLFIPLVIISIMLIKAGEKRHYHLASLLTKAVMIGGLLYSFIAFYLFEITYNLNIF